MQSKKNRLKIVWVAFALIMPVSSWTNQMMANIDIDKIICYVPPLPETVNKGYRPAYNNFGDDADTSLNTGYVPGYNSINNNVHQNKYSDDQSGIATPVYKEDRRDVIYGSTPKPTPEYGGLASFNQNSGSTTDSDFNRAEIMTVTSSATLTESALIASLSSEGRAIYFNLDSQGKALAIQLASQDVNKDKDFAVKEAGRRMSERRGLLNR